MKTNKILRKLGQEYGNEKPKSRDITAILQIVFRLQIARFADLSETNEITAQMSAVNS